MFREVANETGLRFQHFNGATGEWYEPEIMGSGIALLDFDGDGDLDVLLLQGRVLDNRKNLADALFPPPAGWRPGCRLFRNNLVPSGKLSFTDVTDQAGLATPDLYGMGVAVGDYDNDGHPDLFFSGIGRNILYHNEGDGTFTNVTTSAGLSGFEWSTSAAFLDYDRDGRLDLFVAQYVNFTTARRRECHAPTGELDYCDPKVYRPLVSHLFHNEGDGRFRDVTGASGVGSAAGPGLGVVSGDFDGDGWPDIYVSNDGAASYLWLNQRNGTFRESALNSGVAYGPDGEAQAGMGVAAGDYDNKGRDSIFKTNLTGQRFNLYRNDGKGLFTDIIASAGLAEATSQHTGFGDCWFDFDNDGWLDLFSANGAVRRVESQRGMKYPYYETNLLLHNEVGIRFRDVTRAAADPLMLPNVGRGLAVGDIDNDGRLDLVVSANNGPARLYLNRSEAGHWLKVRLEGMPSNRMGLGSRVGVLRKGRPALSRMVRTDGSYLSASDATVHFGLGADPVVEKVLVQWADGYREVWRDIRSDSTVTLREHGGVPQP